MEMSLTSTPAKSCSNCIPRSSQEPCILQIALRDSSYNFWLHEFSKTSLMPNLKYQKVLLLEAISDTIN